MARIIQAKAWRTKGTVGVARGLLGKYLVRRRSGRIEAHLITEVEAYLGESDLASHASRGRTRRTGVLYAAGGVWYVYLIYGIHEMLNLVVGPSGHPTAVLIRGVAGITGPGRVTRALGIGRALNGQPASRPTGLWIEDRGVRVSRRAVRASPRVGVDYAGPVWAAKPWRFRWEPPARAGG
jgi:DNA-3-methyladenine glycosylase